MILPTDDYDYLRYLAEELEVGDDFEKHARQFKQLAEMLSRRVYRYCKDPDILDLADKLPTIKVASYQRSFLEQLLPRSGRDMVGDYKTKTAILQQVRETVARFKEIKRWLGEGEE
jgi:hypothetical protein